jgi:hypothetical protein
MLAGFLAFGFPLRGLCMKVAFPSPLPGRAADHCMFRISGRKSYSVSSAELREYRGQVSELVINPLIRPTMSPD